MPRISVDPSVTLHNIGLNAIGITCNMSKKIHTAMRFATISCLLLVLAFTDAGAAQTYHASKVIKKGWGGTIYVAPNLLDLLGVLDRVTATIPSRSLDAYMNEQGIKSVEITVDMIEERVQQADGSSYYKLEFYFGPTGAYFNPPLELKLTGKYVSPNTDVWLYDENGERLEGTRCNLLDTIIFEIPHFSRYGYDDYSY